MIEYNEITIELILTGVILVLLMVIAILWNFYQNVKEELVWWKGRFDDLVKAGKGKGYTHGPKLRANLIDNPDFEEGAGWTRPE